MARPKLKHRRSSRPPATFNDSGGPVPVGTSSHAAAPEEAERPTWRAQRGWPASNPTVAPVPAEPQPSPADAPEAAADPFDAPFWESWSPTDQEAQLDDAGDGLAEEGSADDAVTNVDPRPRRSWEVTVTPVTDPGDPPEAEGIGQHLGSLAHLSANPRMRMWRRRVIIAIIAGVAFGILLHSWKWGLTFAVLAAIADTIIRSRTTFNGPAGVKLDRDQKNTVRQLDKLRRKGYRALHILPIPDTEDQIDHLVIGPAGVFAIDSVDWDKRMPVRTSSHLKLWLGPTSMNDQLEHAHGVADQAAKLLSAAMGSPVTVRTAMAVYGPQIPWDVAEIRDVDVFSGPRLRKYLRRRARHRGAQPLTEDEINKLDKAAHTAFPQAVGD